MNGNESAILCEGYYDRAFWAGLLSRFRFTDPGLSPHTGERRPLNDPQGKPVRRGHFAFLSPTQRFVRIQPCHARANVLRAARIRLSQADTNPLDFLVINRDWDIDVRNRAADMDGTDEQRIHDVANNLGLTHVSGVPYRFTYRHQNTKVFIVDWRSPREATAGIPHQQTLERLVCAAIAAAYPDRAPAVEAWLRKRPSLPDEDPKAHAWSYMAGWWAHLGCDAFFRAIWDDAKIAEQLESDLKATRIWSVVESLAT